MFNVEAYYEEAHSGEKVDNTGLLDYIRSYKNVVLWGGSYLGTAVGKYLLEHGIEITHYWDMRAEELKEVNGIKVVMPFTTEDKENSLVIFCIGNNVIRRNLLKKLENRGYHNIIRGDYVFMGAICPFSNGSEIDSKICQGSMCCRSIFCQRLSSIVKNRDLKEEPLHTFSITLVINQKCSLKCKCCTSYMNEYPLGKRINMPTERILDDIDKFFAAMDSVGTVTVMGGEPFMHPDLSIIIKKLLTKNNFGIISIATSGTWPIQVEQLDGLEDKRVNVSFSNYTQSITDNQKKVMDQNVDLLKKNGIAYTMGIYLPEWTIPSTLYDLNESEEILTEKKKRCIQPPRCMQVKNGKLHPCDFGTAVYSLGIADYKTDYVDIEHSESISDLREKIRVYINQPYYRVCGHCKKSMGLTSKAAEQGYMDFKKPLTLQQDMEVLG